MRHMLTEKMGKEMKKQAVWKNQHSEEAVFLFQY